MLLFKKIKILSIQNFLMVRKPNSMCFQLELKPGQEEKPRLKHSL